jgi:hypothetical protein
MVWAETFVRNMYHAWLRQPLPSLLPLPAFIQTGGVVQTGIPDYAILSRVNPVIRYSASAAGIM